MENWQFLIQQQGDRSWRPLESPTEEITEGRYRIVARSNRTNMDVEVRIAHTSTLEMPPKRRIQRRSRRVNSDGLMAVIPFTYLKPGIWELRCSSNLVSDVLGTSWQQDIRLQVLPKVTIGQAGQESKEVLAADSDDERDEDILPVNPVWLKGETAEQILNNLIELALPDSEAVLVGEETAEDSLAILECLLSLVLDREIYTVSWGQTLTINGYVKLKESIDYERIYSGEIRIELYSPQASELIRRVRQSLPEKSLPFNIRCSIEIPVECVSKLILAEISLYGTISLGSKTLLLARESFTITADVADLLAVSATSYKESDIVEDTQEVGLFATSEAKKSNIPIGLEFFNLVKTAKISEPLAVNPIPNKTLPPKIHKDSSRQSSPQLPRISSMQNKALSPGAVVPTLSSADDIGYVRTRSTTFPYLRQIKAFISDGQKVESKPLELFNFQPLVSNQQEIVETPYEDFAQLEVGDTQVQNEPLKQDISQPNVEETQTQDRSLEQDSSPLGEEERESQKRSLIEIFPVSSSDLIVTGEPSTSPLIRQWMQSQGYAIPEPINLRDQDYYDIDTVPISVEEEKETQEEEARKSSEEVQTQAGAVAESQEAYTVIQPDVATNVIAEVSEELSVKSTNNLPVTTSPYSKARFTLLAQEIVVDDNFDEPLPDLSTPNLVQHEEQTASDLPIVLPTASAMAELLPVPQIYLPKGELISGKSVMLRVRLTERRSELAVKFWVEDCQTRQLIDGPRWLINFLPLISGGMEELIHINVPYGCLEIRLEAIALNMATKQESDKVSIQKTVVPPDLPQLRPDELLGI
ncbi:hypothetical protein [Scytonema sp. NUACC26]|uniref:hypothetical protein n=1 Tax=Scytonema sp. NUACC26 TaxID=3140176 RepID=UPI0034DC9BB0